MTRGLLGEVALLEHRGDRAYDEQDASTVVMPDGSLACTYDRTLCVSFVRARLGLPVA